MLSYLPRRDEVPGIATPSIGNQIENPVHLPKRTNTVFAVIVAIIDRLYDFRVIENKGGFQKIDFPSLPVFLPFFLVP